MKLIFPPLLKNGGTIGVIAPSRFVDEYKNEINDSIIRLKRSGFTIKFGKNFYQRVNNSAGTIEQRVSDIHDMVKDQNIGAVVCALGGDTAKELLPHLDYELIRKNPKMFVGFSDFTNLLLAFYQKAGLVTFYGPSLKDVAGLTDDSYDFLLKMLVGGGSQNYPKQLNIIRSGKVEGEMIGGNLYVLNSLVDSDYMPVLKDKILFLEDIEDEVSDFNEQFQLLKERGVLNQIGGLVLGRFITKKQLSMREMVKELTSGLNYPIISVDFFGHQCKNFYVLPLGGKAVIDTENMLFFTKFIKK